MDEPGIGDEPPHEIIQRLIALDRFGKRLSGLRSSPASVGELAFVVLLEGDAFGIGTIEIALYLRIIDAEIKIGQVPLRQGAERSCRARIGGRATGVLQA